MAMSMSCNARSTSATRAECGFVLVAILFLLVVGSMAVITLGYVTSARAQNHTLAIHQVRAEQAMQAGLEWGRSRAEQGHDCNGTLTSLAGFAVAVSCQHLETMEIVEEGRTAHFYRIEALASRSTPDQPDYIQRRGATLTEF